ncbi:MAG: GNAT family N-acetyltransferase [Oscillospiraceae bacterium]|nr:GNAT family N-acetyltransferase [Oscillospiraceae bacterium]
MTIRDLQTQDIPALAELYRQFWGDDSDVAKMKNKFAELRARNDYILLCAIEEDNVCGSVMGIVCEELYGDCLPFLLLENMVVDGTSRREGVGKALLARLEELAKSKGCRQIILVTESDRDDARGFYAAVGFHPTANAGFKKKLI